MAPGDRDGGGPRTASGDVPSGARRWLGGGPDNPRHAPAHRATPRFVAAEELQRHSSARRGRAPTSSTWSAKDNPSDERLIALAEVRDVTPQLNEAGEVVGVPAIERTLAACLDGIRRAQTQRGKRRLDNNRVALYVWPVLDIPATACPAIVRRIAPLTINAGLEEITILASIKDDETSQPRRVAIRFSYTPGAGVVANVTDPPTEPLRASRRVRTEGAALTSPRLGLPVRTDPGSHRQRRQVRRIRLRRIGRIRTGGPAVWTQHRRAHRRLGDAAHASVPRRHDPGGHVR